MDNSTEMIYGRCHIIKDWPDWEYSVHDNKSQIDRQGRSMTYPSLLRWMKMPKPPNFQVQVFFLTMIQPYLRVLVPILKKENFLVNTYIVLQ